MRCSSVSDFLLGLLGVGCDPYPVAGFLFGEGRRQPLRRAVGAQFLFDGREDLLDVAEFGLLLAGGLHAEGHHVFQLRQFRRGGLHIRVIGLRIFLHGGPVAFDRLAPFFGIGRVLERRHAALVQGLHRAFHIARQLLYAHPLTGNQGSGCLRNFDASGLCRVGLRDAGSGKGDEAGGKGGNAILRVHSSTVPFIRPGHPS